MLGQCSCIVYPFQSRKKQVEMCIDSAVCANSVYIESANTLSDTSLLLEYILSNYKVQNTQLFSMELPTNSIKVSMKME